MYNFPLAFQLLQGEIKKMTPGDIGSINFKVKEERDEILKLFFKIPIIQSKKIEKIEIEVLESLAKAYIKKYNYSVPILYIGDMKAITGRVEKNNEHVTIIYALTILEFYLKLVCFMHYHNLKKRYIR